MHRFQTREVVGLCMIWVCVFEFSLCVCVCVSGCQDKKRVCDPWARLGFCERRRSFMKKHCPQRCDLCYGMDKPLIHYTDIHASMSHISWYYLKGQFWSQIRCRYHFYKFYNTQYNHNTHTICYDASKVNQSMWTKTQNKKCFFSSSAHTQLTGCFQTELCVSRGTVTERASSWLWKATGPDRVFIHWTHATSGPALFPIQFWSYLLNNMANWGWLCSLIVLTFLSVTAICPFLEPLDAISTPTPPPANVKVKMVPRGKVVGFRCGTKSAKVPPKVR